MQKLKEKLKQYGAAIVSLLAFVLGAVFYKQRKELARTKSDLAKAVNNTNIAVNDVQVANAKQTADALEDAYKKLKGES